RKPVPLSSSHARLGSEHVAPSTDTTVSEIDEPSVSMCKLDSDTGRLSVTMTSTPPPPNEHDGVWSSCAPTSVPFVTGPATVRIGSCSPLHDSLPPDAAVQLGSAGKSVNPSPSSSMPLAHFGQLGPFGQSSLSSVSSKLVHPGSSG